jgi:histidinol dehydrogenase
MLKMIYADGKREYAFLKELEKRNAKTNVEVENTVREIIENVYENGDKALKEYSVKFDKADLDRFEVASEEMEKAYNSVSKELILALEQAYICLSPKAVKRGLYFRK